YSSFTRSRPDNDEPDLILLSVSPNESIHELTAATERVFSPKAILLLSDSNNMRGHMPELPQSVAGHIPKNSPPEALQAAIRLVLAGGSCFPMQASTTNTRAPVLPKFESGDWPAEEDRKNKAAGPNP